MVEIIQISEPELQETILILPAMVSLPTIYTIQASDAPRHTDKLRSYRNCKPKTGSVGGNDIQIPGEGGFPVEVNGAIDRPAPEDPDDQEEEVTGVIFPRAALAVRIVSGSAILKT